MSSAMEVSKADGAYEVHRNGQRIAYVFKGWLALGGQQWVVQMSDRAAFGERTLRAALKRLEKLAGGAA